MIEEVCVFRSAPLSEEDQAIWINVMGRFGDTMSIYTKSMAMDRKDYGLMLSRVDERHVWFRKVSNLGLYGKFISTRSSG
jgi:hypothetical protein